MLSHAQITDEELLKLFPQDQETADAILTEIVRSVLAHKTDPPDAFLENRPDWQEALQRGIDARLAARTISHEDVLRWHEKHRPR